MTIKNKIGNGLGALGLVGLLGISYDTINSPPPIMELSSAAKKMYDIESELRIKGNEPIDEKKLDKHLILISKYKALSNEPSLLEERRRYEDSWKKYNDKSAKNFLYSFGFGLLIGIPYFLRKLK